jgi:CRP-like cAMP-binding protein
VQHPNISFLDTSSNSNNPACKSFWQSFAGQSTQHQYPPGTVLYGQSQVLHLVHRLDEGLVKILHRRRSGREVVVGIRTAGAPLGITAVILGRATYTTAITLTPCSVTAVSAAAFLQHLWSDPNLMRDVVSLQSVKARDYLERLSLLECVPAKQRVELFLRSLVKRFGATSDGVLRFRLPFTQTDLAQVVNVTPETLSRILAHLERDAIISRSNGWISIQLPTVGACQRVGTRLAERA